MPETACQEKIVLKIKSIVMRTTNNLLRKVHNYIHCMGWFTQFIYLFIYRFVQCTGERTIGHVVPYLVHPPKSLNENVIFWRFFIIFSILNVFARLKNGKFQSPKSSTGTSISLKSLILRLRTLSLLLKSVFKIMGNLKENFEAKI